MKMAQLLGSQGSWQHQLCRDTDHLSCRDMVLSECFSSLRQPGHQRASLYRPSLLLCPFRDLKGTHGWGPTQLFGTSGV